MSRFKPDPRVIVMMRLKTMVEQIEYIWICPECKRTEQIKANRKFVMCGKCRLSFDVSGVIDGPIEIIDDTEPESAQDLQGSGLGWNKPPKCKRCGERHWTNNPCRPSALSPRRSNDDKPI